MSKVYFRFYEELNDHLPEEMRKVWFEYPLKDRISVQEAISSLGVPPAEVDLILVNQLSKGFDYILQDEDRISVYPVFELFDISEISELREKPLREIRFICDVHLGKLSRYMRMLGFDTLYSNQYTNEQIIQIATEEKRIILSRNCRLIRDKRVTHSYWVRSSDPLEQIRDLVNKLDLSNSIDPLTRCMECNGILVPVDKQQILPQLEPRTANYFNEFFRCNTCAHIYWKGSHFENMLGFIDQHILPDEYDYLNC